MTTIEYDIDEYITRVEGLRPSRPRTEGIELDPEQTQKADSAIREVKESGYAIVPGFLSAERLERVRVAMESIFAMTGTRNARGTERNPGIQAVHVHNLFAKPVRSTRLRSTPVLLVIIEGVLGPQFQMSVATAMCPDPGVDAQQLHPDDGHYPLPRPRPPFIANTLIALDDFTAANGATRIVPGSHLRTEPVRQDAESQHAEMTAGSLLVFDGALWHAGGANTTTQSRRRTINLSFNLSWLRQQENQHVGIPRVTRLAMPERLQRLLGFQKVNFLYGSVD